MIYYKLIKFNSIINNIKYSIRIYMVSINTKVNLGDILKEFREILVSCFIDNWHINDLLGVKRSNLFLKLYTKSCMYK